MACSGTALLFFNLIISVSIWHKNAVNYDEDEEEETVRGRKK
jgi:hypothetical protein